MDVDPRADKALYLQLADVLRQDVQHGRWQPGERLPSETDLINQYDVSRGTARKAISVLRNEGVVIVEHGRGAFVRPDDTSNLFLDFVCDEPIRGIRGTFESACIAQGLTPTVSEMSDDEFSPSPPAGLPSDASEELLLLNADGHPIALARVWSSADDADGMTQQVSARMPTRRERRLLQLDDGHPVMCVDRTLSSHGRPVQHSREIHAASRAALRIVARRNA